MNEAIPPCPERRSNVSESSVILDFPNIPPSNEDHFPKERFVEILSGVPSNFNHVITILPNNLQIIPHTHAEIAQEKKDGFYPQVSQLDKEHIQAHH